MARAGTRRNLTVLAAAIGGAVAGILVGWVLVRLLLT